MYCNHPPTKAYNGLTIVLSNPSRFDIRNNPPELLSGSAGYTVKKYFLGPDIDVTRCHIFDIHNETNQEKIKFQEGTKVVLLCGRPARDLLFPQLSEYSISSQRGGVFTHNSHPNISFVLTFSPQDTFDPVDLEPVHNPLLKKAENSTEGLFGVNPKDEADEDGGDKDHSVTSRDNWRFWLEQDIKKSKKILYFGLPTEASPDISINADVQLILDFFKRLETGEHNLYLDIETDSNLNINTLGVSDDTRCFVIPTIRHDYSPNYPFRDLGRIFKALQRAFLNPQLTVVIHNSLFDLVVLALKYNIHPPVRVFDTMLAQHRCYPETEKSLGHCISMWTCNPFHKDEGIFEPWTAAQAQQLWEYNAKDLLGTRLVYLAQKAYIGFDAGLQASIDQVNAAIVPYLCNSFLGIKVDVAEVEKIVNNNTRLLTQYQRILIVLVGSECGHTLLPTSSKSCAAYFHDLLGYAVVGRTNKGAPALGAAELYKLKLKYPDNIALDFCLKYRQLVKESGQIQFKLWSPKNKLQQYSNQRATTGWKLSGTTTFRLSSAKWLQGYGTNLQNPVKTALRIFCADTGKVFVQADQAGAEALIVAYLTRRGNFRELFLNGIKSHNYVALHLYFQTWCKVIPEALRWLTLAPADLVKQPRWPEFLKLIKDDEDRYYIAKKTCHAANYGMKENTFITAVLKDSEGSIVLDVQTAKRFLGTYHSLFPEIQAWHLSVQEQLKDTRELRNLFGYPRRFYGAFDDSTWKEAYAYVPQSTVGTITNIAFTAVHNAIQSGSINMDLLNNKHDSLLGQVEDNEQSILQGARCLAKALEQELVSPTGEHFWMKSEVSVGYNWEKYHKDKNTKGMKDFKL